MDSVKCCTRLRSLENAGAKILDDGILELYTLQRMSAGRSYEQMMMVRLTPVMKDFRFRLLCHYVVIVALVAAWQPRS
jgi:hypothetical protein